MPDRRPLVLILDADDAGRTDKLRALQREGVDAIASATGQEGLRLLERHQPTLVLFKVELPDIDGLSLCRTIKQDWPETLILQTSERFVAGEDEIGGPYVGADAYLTEPIEPKELIATVRALHRIRRAEGRLRENEERLRLVIDGAKDHAIFTTDPNGLITSWSAGAEAIFGWSPEEAIGQPTGMIFTPEDRAAGIDALELATASREGCANNQRWHLRKDGARVFMNGSLRPLHDAAGRDRGFLKVARDETHQREADDLLAATAANFRTLADNIPALCWMADAQGAIYWYNQRWYTYTGTTPERMTGWGWTSVHDPAMLPSVMERWTRSLTSGTPFEMVFPLKGADGAFRPFLTRVAPVLDPSGHILRWFGTNVDISEQRAAEARLRELNETLEQRVDAEVARRVEAEEQLRQAQKMEAVGQLTGGIAHDFNNLLQIITGNLELLSRNLPADAQRLRRSAENAMVGAQRAATLTERLLAFSRRQPLAPKAINVNTLIVGMSDLLTRALGETVALDTVLATGLWRVDVDPNQLENALLNLALNAHDAMPNGGKLTIETGNAHLDEPHVLSHVAVGPGQYVLIRVADTGEGMDSETRQRAFEPFFTTKEVGRGTGLGLSMVYGFVKQSGGNVTIHSEAGQGTTITIYLPRLLGEAEDEPATDNHAVPSASRHETVLAVEDDDDVRTYTVQVLVELGYRVLEARNGPAALELLESPDGACVDLLFTDVVLPGGMNGEQLAARARELCPALTVLFTTGYARDAIVHGGRLDPGVHLITKPFTRTGLAAKIRELLDKVRA